MPSNLFLATHGDSVALKLLDFGVGRVVDEAASTRTGKPNASSRIQLLLPTYAAPEQLLGTLGPTGPWTDVYALALVLLEVLSDRMVMGAKDASTIARRTLNQETRPTPREHGLDLPAGSRCGASCVRSRSNRSRVMQTSTRCGWSSFARAVRRATSVVASRGFFVGCAGRVVSK